MSCLRRLAAAFARIGPNRNIAVEIFRDCDFGRQRAPALRHLDIFLFENDPAGIIRDLGSPAFPFYLIERFHSRTAENALEPQRGSFFPGHALTATIRRGSCFFQ